MVQQLADSKLTLEERVKDLEEAVADLEALQDMNEQLQEGSRELEVELREEVDLAHFTTREVCCCSVSTGTMLKCRSLVCGTSERCVAAVFPLAPC
jgi:hypothetical protein